MFQSTSFLASVGLTLLAIVVAVVAQGQEIGSLYQCAHGLRGKVFVKNEREIIIQGFNYDGKGPAAWFHGQLKGSQGIYTSDPTMYETLPYPNGTCDRLKPGRSYADEDITLILPQSIKDFETIGVFCYQYCHNFGHIRIPSDLNVPAAPITLQLVNNCGKPNYDTCSLEKTRNRDITPDCPAGAPPSSHMPAGSAGKLIPSVFIVVLGWLSFTSFDLTRK